MTVVVSLIGVSSTEAYTVLVTETHQLDYEEGSVKHQRHDRRDVRYDVDEERGLMTRMTREAGGRDLRSVETSLQGAATTYTIRAIEPQATRTETAKPQTRDDQRVIAAVGQAASGVPELIVLGQDFYLDCQAATGRISLAIGTVRRVPSHSK